jgi:hypothetical protein
LKNSIQRKIAFSRQPSAFSQINSKSSRKKSFDKTVIRQSNGTLAFVCNRTPYPRVGYPAERTGRGPQKVIAKITAIARIDN